MKLSKFLYYFKLEFPHLQQVVKSPYLKGLLSGLNEMKFIKYPALHTTRSRHFLGRLPFNNNEDIDNEDDKMLGPQLTVWVSRLDLNPKGEAV